MGKRTKWAQIVENQLYSNNQRCSGGLANGGLNHLSSSVRLSDLYIGCSALGLSQSRVYSNFRRKFFY